MSKMIELQCSHCKHTSQYEVSEEMQGLTLLFVCKNDHCKKKIKHKIPKTYKGPIEHTYINTGKQKIVTGASLVIIHPEPQSAAAIQLQAGVQIIGRAHVADYPEEVRSIFLEDLTLSRQHATIVGKRNSLSSMVYALSDAQSKNGTFLNTSRRLSAGEVIYLEDGDLITLGSTKLRFTEEYLQQK